MLKVLMPGVVQGLGLDLTLGCHALDKQKGEGLI
jgi:hypothetical protein